MRTLIVLFVNIAIVAAIYTTAGTSLSLGCFVVLYVCGSFPEAFVPTPFQLLYKLYCSHTLGYNYIRKLIHQSVPTPHSDFVPGIRHISTQSQIVTEVHWDFIQECYSGLVIVPVPMFSDNYSYLILCCASHHVAVIDPADASCVLEMLEVVQHQTCRPWIVTHILTTHRHWDHSGGNEELMNLSISGARAKLVSKQLQIFGSEIDAPLRTTRFVHDNDEILLSVGMRLRVFLAPFHTAGHVIYAVTSTNRVTEKVSDVELKNEADSGSTMALFVGDVLFSGGCGAFFECTDASMVAKTHNLFRDSRIRTSNNNDPLVKYENIFVYCGHEYSERLLGELYRYIQQRRQRHEVIAPHHLALEKRVIEVASLRGKKGLPSCTVPSTLAVELQTNPLLTLKQHVLDEMVHQKESLSRTEIENIVYSSDARRSEWK